MEGVRSSLRKKTQRTHPLLGSEKNSLAEVAVIVRKPITVKAVDMNETCLDDVGCWIL